MAYCGGSNDTSIRVNNVRHASSVGR
jgi:hypothetical protein